MSSGNGAPARGRLSISVIIPAHNAAEDLPYCLAALLNGSSPPEEIIVIDDGSTDGTVDVAAAYSVTVLSVNGRRGAAYPRNVGARIAKGDLLLFVDADVVVHSETVGQFRAHFEADRDLAALMGSYDETPTCAELLSQYRNLMHCYTHQVGSRNATTFWTGCGAVRRDVFEQVRGFDEQYQAMEDVDLGRRLSVLGYRIELNPAIKGTHRKQWTFGKMVTTDIFHRGIPWTLIILRSGGGMPNELNLKWTQRLCVVGVGLMMVVAALALYHNGVAFLAPLLGSALLISGTYWTQALSQRSTAEHITLIICLGMYLSLGLALGNIAGPVLVLSAYTFLIARCLFLKRHRQAQRVTSWAYGFYLIGSLVYMIQSMPGNNDVFLFWLLGTGVVAMNHRFYLFLCRRLGFLYGLATVPFHLLFHLYGGLSFGIGLFQYFIEKRKQNGLGPIAHRVKG